MEIELLKKVNTNKKFVTSKGKELNSFMYVMVINGSFIPIKPLFNEGYVQLDLLSKTCFVGKEKK